MAIPGAGSNYLTGLVVQKGNSWNAQKNNFGPQIGFAWSPTKFNDKLVIRGGYGLNYNQEEIAISANIRKTRLWWCFRRSTCPTPTRRTLGILYATSSDLHSFVGFPSNPNTIVDLRSERTAYNWPGECQHLPAHLPTMRVHHYSLDTQYDLGHQIGRDLGLSGKLVA